LVPNVRDQLFTTGFTKPIYSPTLDENPDHVAVDGAVIRLDDEYYQLYAAVDLE